jgi:flagellar protein FliL
MAAKKPPVEDEEKEDADQASADGEGGDAASLDPPDGKFGKKKLLMYIGALVLMLLLIGGGLYFTGMLDGVLGKKAAVECAEGDEHCVPTPAEGEGGAEGEHGAAAGGHGASGAFLPIPTMIVNLASDDGTPRYLRLTVQLELKDQNDLHQVEAVIPRVIDQFQTYLRELRVRDLRGSSGIYRLQMELLWRVNQAAAPVEVKDVLFQEILIQ